MKSTVGQLGLVREAELQITCEREFKFTSRWKCIYIMNRPAGVTQTVDALKEEFETLGTNHNDK